MTTGISKVSVPPVVIASAPFAIVATVGTWVTAMVVENPKLHVWAYPVLSSVPTMSPFVSGRHVYDYGRLLSANSVKLAETLAAQIEAAVDAPLLHIADATAAQVKAAGVARVGLLGTRFTMEEPFYRGRLEAHGRPGLRRGGLHRLPRDPPHQDR